MRNERAATERTVHGDRDRTVEPSTLCLQIPCTQGTHRYPGGGKRRGLPRLCQRFCLSCPCFWNGEGWCRDKPLSSRCLCWPPQSANKPPAVVVLVSVWELAIHAAAIAQCGKSDSLATKTWSLPSYCHSLCPLMLSPQQVPAPLAIDTLSELSKC